MQVMNPLELAILTLDKHVVVVGSSDLGTSES